MSDLNDEKAGWTVEGLLGAVERLTRRAEAADAEVERWRVEYGRQHDRADRLAAENRVLRARLAAVEALAGEWESDRYRVLDGEQDPRRLGWRTAVIDHAERLRAALASVPAVDAGDREPASEGERVADGVVWEFVDGDWREKPCRTCSGSGDAPSSAGIVTDCSDCEGSGYTIPVSEAVRAPEPRSGAPEATGTFGGFEAVTEAHSAASEVQP